MSPSPKFFRVATEGATIDGRTIKRVWLEQMAQRYSPQLYSARVFIEHIRGMVPDGPFKAYGDVLALKTQEGPDGKLSLLAQIEPTPELVALIKTKQKIYTSVEIDPHFADTKAAYLVGLGITDSPASLGTERLSFTRQTASAHVFSEAVEMLTEEEETEMPSMLSKVKTLLGLSKYQTAQEDQKWRDDLNNALETLARHSKEQLEAFTHYQERLHTLETHVKELATCQAQDKTAFHALKQQLELTSDHTPRRPVATGSRTAILSDC